MPLLTTSVSLLVKCSIAECVLDDANGLCNGQSAADTQPHDEVVLLQMPAPRLLHQSKLHKTKTRFEKSRPCKGSGEYLSKGEGNEDFWRCASGGFCIPGRYRCNGIKECKDGSDELMCVPLLAAKVRLLASQLADKDDQQTGAAKHSSHDSKKKKTKKKEAGATTPQPSSNESNVADDAPLEDSDDSEDFSGGVDLQSQLDTLRADWMHSEGSSSRDDDLQSQLDALRQEVKALKTIIRSNGNASKDTDSLRAEVEALKEIVHSNGRNGVVGGDASSKTEPSGRTQANKSSLDASLIADEIAALNANMASSSDELDGTEIEESNLDVSS